MLGKIWDKLGKTLENDWNSFWTNLGEVWKNLFKFRCKNEILQKNSLKKINNFSDEKNGGQ